MSFPLSRSVASTEDWSLEAQFRRVHAKLKSLAVFDSLERRSQDLQNLGVLEMLRLGGWMRIIDPAWVPDAQILDAAGAERKILGGLRGMPADLAKCNARLVNLVAERRDRHVQGSCVERAEVEAELGEKRPLHGNGAAGKTRIAVQTGGDSVPALKRDRDHRPIFGA